MRSKKEQKPGKQAETKPGTQKKVKSLPEAKAAKTIKQVVIDSITANSHISNSEMIAAVKREFPRSAFNAKHAAWYRSQARKGLLTGTPVIIPKQTQRSDLQSK